MNIKKKLRLPLLLFVFCVQFTLSANAAWYTNHAYIIHALGTYKGDAYTNSKQAFKYYYKKKQRVFEIDLYEVGGQVVCAHNG